MGTSDTAKRKELRLRKDELSLRRDELKLKQWEAKYQAKSEMEAQGFKGLLLINGGAAVALAALFQAVISKPEAVDFVPWVICGIVANIVGVAAVAVIFWVRYMQGLYEDKHGKFFMENPWWPWRWYLAAFSIVCFLVAMGVVAYGGFTKLRLGPAAPMHVINLIKPPPNNALERTGEHRAPRLAAARESWSAAQLDR